MYLPPVFVIDVYNIVNIRLVSLPLIAYNHYLFNCIISVFNKITNTSLSYVGQQLKLIGT